MEHRRTQVILTLCGIAAPGVFALMVITAGACYPGYSHMRQAISELGGVGAQNPLIQNANFFILEEMGSIAADYYTLTQGGLTGNRYQLGDFVGVLPLK